MSAQIFISYSSKDQRVAQTVCEALENRGYGCWISSRDIGPGENFQVAIVRAIRAARVMVLVFSANSNNSDEIKKEIVLAGQSRLIVIPVRVEDVTPDEAFAYEFATRQWVDLFEDWESAMQRLVRQLQLAGIAPESAAPPVAQPPLPAPASPAPAPPTRAARGWHGYAASAALVAGAAAAALWLAPRLLEPNVHPSPAKNAATLATPAKPKPPPAEAASAAPAAIRPAAPDAFAAGQAAEVRHDYPAALRFYRDAAERQHVVGAWASIGFLYEHGLGVPQDYARAVQFYRKGAEAAGPVAQAALGNLYGRGLGVRRNFAEAVRWWRPAAGQGNALAEAGLAGLYMNGWGMPQDFAAAMSWAVKAAAQGNSGGDTVIGFLNLRGWGVPIDYDEALRRFRKAIAQGNPDAENDLGLMYLNGWGVPRDYAEKRDAGSSGRPTMETSPAKIMSGCCTRMAWASPRITPRRCSTIAVPPRPAVYLR